MPRLFSKEARDYILSNPQNLTRTELAEKFNVSLDSITNLIYNSTHQAKVKEALRRVKQDKLRAIVTSNNGGDYVDIPNMTNIVLNGVNVRYDSSKIVVKVRTDKDFNVLVDIAPNE